MQSHAARGGALRTAPGPGGEPGAAAHPERQRLAAPPLSFSCSPAPNVETKAMGRGTTALMTKGYSTSAVRVEGSRLCILELWVG